MNTGFNKFLSGLLTSGELHKLRLSERGVVIEMFALFLGLIAVLAFGLSLQMPTNQASALRAHHALQNGSAVGVMSLSDKGEAANKAWQTANEIIQNGYVTESGGLPSGRFSSDLSNFTILIPNRLSGGYNAYGNCSGSTCSPITSGIPAKALQIAARIFDISSSAEYGTYDFNGWHTYDSKNGMLIYSEVSPLAHSIYKSSNPQPVVSVTVLNPSLTYVLIDTAMSMSPTNYQFIFGANENSGTAPSGFDSANQWPVVYDRESGSPKLYPNSGWQYPTAVGGMRYGPRGESQLSNQQVRNFFASACFNSPWDLYKGAIVDLLDWMTSISSYDRYTAVGLVAPIRSARDLDYTFTTANTAAGVPTNFSPLAHYSYPSFSGGGSEGPTSISTPGTLAERYSDMHMGQVGWSSVFQGWLKPFDPYDRTGANKKWDKLHNGDPDGPGVNMWNTMLCRALVTTDTNDGGLLYSLNEDINSKFDPNSGAPDFEPDQDTGNDRFDYRNVNSRRRTAATPEAPQWRRWVTSYHSWLFHSISLNDGAGGTFHGVRNFVAGLAPSWNGFQKIIEDVAGQTNGVNIGDQTGNWATWSRDNTYGYGGNCDNTYLGAVFASNVSAAPYCNRTSNAGEMISTPDPEAAISAPAPTSDQDTTSRLTTAWRDIPSAMRAACEALAVGKSTYMSNAFLATERPLGTSRLVVFGFGLYSPITAQAVANSTAIRQQALTEAINFCSCTKNIEIIFNFLPLSPWDRQTVMEAADVVSNYQRKYDHSCKPMYFPDTPITGCAQTKSIQFSVSEPTDYTDSAAMVDAAVKFRENIELLKPLFAKFVYKM